MVYTRVRDGVFVRVARGIYALPGAATRHEVILDAACRALGAVVSHMSAAKLHKLGPLPRHTPTITVAHRSTHTFPGVEVHQSTDMVETHTTILGSVRVTTPERTIIDLSQVMHERRLDTVLDRGLASGVVDFELLISLHRSMARKGKPGVAMLRRLLEERGMDTRAVDSELERRFLRLITDAALPVPETQFRAPWLSPIGGRIDFAYPDRRLVVEVDGRRWHALSTAFESDRVRDNAAQLAGWRVLRFTWKMVVDEPLQVVSVLRQALSADRHHSRER